MLGHEKKNRVTRQKVRRMVDLVNDYVPGRSDDEDSSGDERVGADVAAVPVSIDGISSYKYVSGPSLRATAPRGQQPTFSPPTQAMTSPNYMTSPTGTLEQALAQAEDSDG